jgi:hypothetical protein
VDNSRSAWAIIFDVPPPRRLGVCVSVCLRSLFVFYGRECNCYGVPGLFNSLFNLLNIMKCSSHAFSRKNPLNNTKL